MVHPRVASWLQAGPFGLIMSGLVLIPLAFIVAVSFIDFGFAEIIPEFYLGNWQDVLRSSLTLDTYATVLQQVDLWHQRRGLAMGHPPEDPAAHVLGRHD